MDAWVTLIGAGGAGAALLAIVNGVFGWLNGSHERVTRRSMDLVGQRDEALRREQQAHDDEAEVRRELAHAYNGLNEYRQDSGVVRYACLLHGVPPEALPPKPRWKPYRQLLGDEKPDPIPERKATND